MSVIRNSSWFDGENSAVFEVRRDLHVTVGDLWLDNEKKCIVEVFNPYSIHATVHSTGKYDIIIAVVVREYLNKVI